MPEFNLTDASQFVSSQLASLHKKKLKKLSQVTIKDIVERKNPYLFRAKSPADPIEYVDFAMQAFFSSSEETVFGNFLEKISIEFCKKVYDGRKSSTKGLDLEFSHASKNYFISIKSGAHWGNSSQLEKLGDVFISIRRTLRTSEASRNMSDYIFVNGCCYGKDNRYISHGDYWKKCGQEYWKLITGNEMLYEDLIIPFGDKARERSDEFRDKYHAKRLELVRTFSSLYTTNDQIDWSKIINSISRSDI